MSVNAGELRHRVTLEAVAHAQSGDGTSETPTTIATVWAAIEPAAAAAVARIFGGRLQDPVSSLVTVRDRSDLTNAVLKTLRLTYGGRTFRVRGWQRVDERGVWLVLACEELP